MNVVIHHILQFRPRKVRLVFGNVKFGQLHFGAGVRMFRSDLLPDFHGGVGFTQRGERFGQRHQGVAVIMFRILSDNTFEQWTGFGGAFLPEQALAKMGAGVQVFGSRSIAAR